MKKTSIGLIAKDLVTQPVIPAVRIPWKNRALIETDRNHLNHKGQPIAKISEVNWKSLERSKYAPWGIGVNTCLYKE